MCWLCRVVQDLGKGHQTDMCQDTCAAQHQWFYVRVCPDRSQTTKPGLKRKRRLDLKMDLSSSNRCDSFQKLLRCNAAQLEVKQSAAALAPYNPLLVYCCVKLAIQNSSRGPANKSPFNPLPEPIPPVPFAPPPPLASCTPASAMQCCTCLRCAVIPLLASLSSSDAVSTTLAV